jgi:hypothetical protein
MSAPSEPPKASTFEPRFVQHGGVRILRLEFSRLSGPEITAAADQVRALVAAEPLGSVRTLTILSSRLSAEGADALKQSALANRPYIRASAVVATSFWKVIAADIQVHGRPELMMFDDEASATTWLVGQ